MLGFLDVDRPCNLGEISKPEDVFICGITPCPGSPSLAWQHPRAFKIPLTPEQKETKSTWMSSKGKKLLQKSQLASTQHTSPRQLSHHPACLWLLHTTFTFLALKLLWTWPGSATHPRPLQGHGRGRGPWSFLPAHQKMPAKSFGSSGSAAGAAHPATDFSWKTWFWHIPQWDWSAEWSLILLIWIMSSDGDKWFLSRHFP